MVPENIRERMRVDWDRRAREDATYYAAFGRRDQEDAEFFASAAPLVGMFSRQLAWLPPETAGSWRALEIGCGPGRLIRLLSSHFACIDGVDVSWEMVRLARAKLRDLPNVRIHLGDGAGLAGFESESFDFVYSYAVFQHVPSREVIFEYLAEARRVLKNGGIFRFQVNGNPARAGVHDTWDGVRIEAPEIAAFARDHDFQLLALEGASTQYLWVTLRKRPDGWRARLAGQAISRKAQIRRMMAAHGGGSAVPSHGRYAAATLWMGDLPDDCDLTGMEAFVGSLPGTLTYLGPLEFNGLRKMNLELPSTIRPGLQKVRVIWLGKPIGPPATLRLVPPGPVVPRIISVTDGVDLLAGPRIVNRVVRITMEEVLSPERIRAYIDGAAAGGIEFYCTDPRVPTFEVNITLPEDVRPGTHKLELCAGSRKLGPIFLDILR